jgi:hypothetical protein
MENWSHTDRYMYKRMSKLSKRMLALLVVELNVRVSCAAFAAAFDEAERGEILLCYIDSLAAFTALEKKMAALWEADPQKWQADHGDNKRKLDKLRKEYTSARARWGQKTGEAFPTEEELACLEQQRRA